MNIIKVVTEEKDFVKKYMNDIMSFEEGSFVIIVGWEFAKTMGAKILNHKIDDKTFWTFSPREKRKIFEEHMQSFPKEILNSLIKDIKITNINPLDYNTEEDYFFYLKNTVTNCTGYLFNEMLYVYCDNNIYHIDSKLLKFLNWDIFEDIKKLLIIKENKEIPESFKCFDLKFIPYLNGEKNTFVGDFHK
jgi:hypothetical protein